MASGVTRAWARLLSPVRRYVGLRQQGQTPKATSTAINLPTALTPERVLAPHTTLVNRIRVQYGCTDDEFRRHLHSPITALAAWLHQLPGHRGGGFERRGGAIEQALTNCLFSLQAADGRSFGARHTEVSSADEQQKWRLACALGGLFHSLHDTLGRVVVVSQDGRVWPSIAIPLLDWLAPLDAPKYHYRWSTAGKELVGPAVYAAARCIAPDVMSFLASGNAQIASALIECIARSRDPPGQVFQVVSRVAAKVAARERSDASLPPEVASDADLNGSDAITDDIAAAAASEQCVLNFTGEPADPDAGRDSTPTTSALSLDTSKITNPLTREAIDQVVARLDHSFDSMLAKTVSGGVFVALAEFVGQHGDGGAVVRALHEAQLLASDAAAADRRVVSEMMEGIDLTGVVLRASAFGGYSDWAGRWQEDRGHKP